MPLPSRPLAASHIANLLESRQRRLPEPAALTLTRRQDLLELDLPEPDFSLYDIQRTVEDTP